MPAAVQSESSAASDSEPPTMPDFVLSTLNAQYAHCSLGLRCLYANLGTELQAGTVLREYICNERTSDVAEKILAEDPKVLGLGVYVWNAQASLALVRMLKAVRPELLIIVGGPEVSHEAELQEIVALADYVVKGEGETALPELLEPLLNGQRPAAKLIDGGQPDLNTLKSPYAFYSDEDVNQRSVYVEAARGCPFRCEFCLSSLDLAVRQFPLEPFLADLQVLMDRGVRHFKFIDRTFNLSPRISSAILQFLLDRIDLGLFLHFEMVPDRLPRALRELVIQFPPGTAQFEIGIQSFDLGTSERISRKQDLGRLEENMRFLRSETTVHVHADLIVGLPGEDAASFARGFNRLVELDPQEIQIGMLKRLRGTTIARHDEEFSMVYESCAPYEILQNSLLSFQELAHLKRFARAWDLVANSGNFRDAKSLLWRGTDPFAGFMHFTNWLFERIGYFSGIALDRLFKLVLEYLSEGAAQPMDQVVVAKVLAADYARTRPRLPSYLAELAGESTRFRPMERKSNTPKRQARHL